MPIQVSYDILGLDSSISWKDSPGSTLQQSIPTLQEELGETFLGT